MSNYYLLNKINVARKLGSLPHSQHNKQSWIYNSFVKINDTMGLLAFTQNINNTNKGPGWLVSFNIDTSGNVVRAAELNFEADDNSYPSLIKLKENDNGSTRVVLGYSGANYIPNEGRPSGINRRAYIRSYDIGSDGSITYKKAFKLHEEYNTEFKYFSLAKTSDSRLVVAYTQSVNYQTSHLKVFDINSDGSFDFKYGLFNHHPTGTKLVYHTSLIKLKDNDDGTKWLVLAFSDHSFQGRIKVFSMASDGTLTNSINNQWLLHHSTPNGSTNHSVEFNSLIKFSDTRVVLAFRSKYTLNSVQKYVGIIKVFDIDTTNGAISQINTLVHDDKYASHNSLIKVTGNRVFLSYNGYNGSDDPSDDNYMAHGILKSFIIADDGSISEEEDNKITHDNNSHSFYNGRPGYNSLIELNNNTLALANYDERTFDDGGFQPSGNIVTFRLPNPTNENNVLSSSITVGQTTNITIVSSSNANNNVWLAPKGTLNFSTSYGHTTVGGTATSITTPSTDGTYNLYVADPSGYYSSASKAVVTVNSNTAPSNQDTVFSSNVRKSDGDTVTIASSGDANNNVWFAPEGTTSFTYTNGNIITTAAGDATSIAVPSDPGPYKLYVIDSNGNYSSASTAVLSVDIQNYVFSSSKYHSSDDIVGIASSEISTNSIWFAPAGTTSFTEGPTMTKAVSGTATTINAPMTTGNYQLYVIDSAGNSSSASTAILTVNIQDIVFSSSITTTPGTSITVASSGNSNNSIWFRNFNWFFNLFEGRSSTATSTADGTATGITTPAPPEAYYLYVRSKNYESPPSVAVLTLTNNVVPNNQNNVFPSDTTVKGGTAVTISSSGDYTNVWFAPEGTTNFSTSSGHTTAAGDATSINAPANDGTYKLYVIYSVTGDYSSASTAILTVDNTAPTINSFAISPSTSGTYIIGQQFTITANTYENIQSGNSITVTLNSTNTTITLTAASAGNTMAGTYTVASGDSTSKLAVDSFTTGTVEDDAGNTMTDTTVPTGSNMFGESTIVIDGIVPNVVAVTSTNENGTYKINDVINITVILNKIINVTGTPQLTLATGANNGTGTVVDYVSGDGTNSLVFEYTVAAGDYSSKLDYTSIDALALNNGTIKDVNGYDAVLTLPEPQP